MGRWILKKVAPYSQKNRPEISPIDIVKDTGGTVCAYERVSKEYLVHALLFASLDQGLVSRTLSNLTVITIAIKWRDEYGQRRRIKKLKRVRRRTPDSMDNISIHFLCVY